LVNPLTESYGTRFVGNPEPTKLTIIVNFVGNPEASKLTIIINFEGNPEVAKFCECQLGEYSGNLRVRECEGDS
jgi:hypothetical protein